MENKDFNKLKLELNNSFDFKNTVFATISGAHLYGFDSYNSDLDIRSSHLPSVFEFMRYSKAKDTIVSSTLNKEIWPEEIDFVSHSLVKLLHLLSKQPNGYLLEQIFSPLVVKTSVFHEKLKKLAEKTITKQLHFHYNGFYENQKLLLEKEKQEVKLILYSLRIIATSVYISKTNKINSNLLNCNEELKIFDKNKIRELIELKIKGEKNNFPENSIKDYWIKEIENKKPLIKKSFIDSKLKDFDKNNLEKEIETFIENNFNLTFFK